jgi:radical SAM-linked protein
MAPGQGDLPATVAFHVPADVSQDEIAARVTELTAAPLERLKMTPERAPAERPHPVVLSGAQNQGFGVAPPETNGHGASHGPRTENGANGNARPDPADLRSYGRRRRVWPTSSRGPMASRYRVLYEKLGVARFTSHLDLVRIFDRALRVARVPMAYSQGFNRHARIAYGPPLSLGATSLGEYFDLELSQACPWSVLLQMNEVLPEGIQILDGRPFHRNVDSLMSAITRADYRITLTGYLLDRLGQGASRDRIREEMERSIVAFRDAAEWPVTKQSHGQAGKTVNARAAVASIGLDPDAAVPGVRLSCRLHASGYLRPDLLVKSLLPSFDFDPRLLLVCREAMWVERGAMLGTPLDVLEESSFWRAVPVDADTAETRDPALEVNASRNRH